MPKEIRTFEVDGDPPTAEPEQFKIVGSTSDGERFEELFTTVLELPLGVIDDVAMSAQIDANGRVAYSRHHVLRVIRTSIVEPERARWDALVRDPDRIVKLQPLVEVMLWLVGTLTDRPTGPPSSSDNGRRQTVSGSGATSSQPDTDQPT